MNVDFKERLWFRIPIDSTAVEKEKLKEALKSGQITTSVELLEWLLQETDEVATGFYDLKNTGADVEMTPEQNNGESTIEFYDDNGKLIYQNGKTG
tara:strand:- start:512 stop:799 length:288 start_codon:yes stop_codon:yes gene_type:complete